VRGLSLTYSPLTMSPPRIRAGMVGLGMIFEETYRPLFEGLRQSGLFRRDFGDVDVQLTAAASRTGRRVEKLPGHVASFSGPNAVTDMVAHGVDAVCIATPDDRHFEPARAALAAGKHVLIEKPSVLRLQELDELMALARQNRVLAKVVYHKLADPDHKKLRSHILDGVLRHVNNGYCSLLEPKQISGTQFAEWIQGRNPGSYVGVHYIKLIDFTFGGQDMALHLISATAQCGLVPGAWDSVQLRIVYLHRDGREAAFDIHTSWVHPDDFPGHVDQEVQFRFDNGVWNAHQRRRGVEMVVEGRSPREFKTTPNHHYSTDFIEPWGERTHRGYGIEVLRRFFEEVAFVEFGGPQSERDQRLASMRALSYNDLWADRNTVAVVQALEAILAHHLQGRAGARVEVNADRGGLVLTFPGRTEHEVLYPARVYSRCP